ncbi:MAG TPA: FtsW/RodA/SpoVE family cell cycle protein, partial [Chitinophagaceae bacterium]|nr:FtsW/RodA/SpoVE family cell cycle protein [Chitinophagaceae bacterium]
MFNKSNIPFSKTSPLSKLSKADIPFASLNKESLLKRTSGDKYIWGIVLVLALISILVVYSATGSLAYKMNKGNNEVYLFKQLSFTVIGLMVMYFLHRINYTLFSRIATLLFFISIPLLIYTLVFGAKINEGSRWIKLPVINMTVQTSDIAKLALFMYISKLLSKKQEVIKDFKKGFLPIITPVLVICVLIMPANLSTALLTGATSLLIMFIGRISLKHILLTILVASIPILFIVSVAWLTYNKSDVNERTKPVVTEKSTNLSTKLTYS